MDKVKTCTRMKWLNEWTAAEEMQMVGTMSEWEWTA